MSIEHDMPLVNGEWYRNWRRVVARECPGMVVSRVVWLRVSTSGGGADVCSADDAEMMIVHGLHGEQVYMDAGNYLP